MSAAPGRPKQAHPRGHERGPFVALWGRAWYSTTWGLT
jgi:hypothetical protein